MLLLNYYGAVRNVTVQVRCNKLNEVVTVTNQANAKYGLVGILR